MQRYFIKKEQINNNQAIINNEDAHHIINVMRMNIGDEVILCDEELTYQAKISMINKKEVHLDIINTYTENKMLDVEVNICQGLIRKEKMEVVIDNVAELGAYSYRGVQMKYSQVGIDRFDEKKIERLNKISKEASEQSQRNKMLKILPFLKWKDFLEESKNYDLKIFAYEKASLNESLNSLLKKDNYHNILILIGPEGGFDPKEVEELYDYGFYSVTLGKRILRSEVACSHIMSVISNYLEDKDV